MGERYKVLKAADLKEGEARAVEVQGRPVAVYSAGGRVYATDGICAHRGGPLGEGKVEGDSIVCPWHGFRFALKDGACSTNPALRVACYVALVDGEDIVVEM